MPSIFVDGIEYRFVNHLYAVSRCGKVLRKLAPFKPRRRSDGYVEAGRNRLVHRVVALLWLEPRPDAKLVHHKDGNKLNNAASNLEWVTPSEHMGDKHHATAGRYRRTKAIRAKLSASRTGFKDSPEVAAKKRSILDEVGPKRACAVDGIKYRSIRQASIALGIHVCTVRQRCLSKNFPNYKMGTRTAG